MAPARPLATGCRSDQGACPLICLALSLCCCWGTAAHLLRTAWALPPTAPPTCRLRSNPQRQTGPFVHKRLDRIESELDIHRRGNPNVRRHRSPSIELCIDRARR
ncbi:hypothetical protein MBOU_29620 [Mycobacterium bourgelatii]|uniref:Uncharacterized protein n=1 Tax=Mycobacterium bourgelatii TaxID=1273442 RepID=A0A7I9YQH0_MYCBU|nr:hypothetical protein MBOU_29620 [Mycobacterium bourgelatii]